MKSLRKENGITLVALVVTIIVLLILAGVSLSLVAGSNGIITKATTAADANTVATAKEQVTLQIAEWTTDFYEDVYVKKSVDVNTKAGDWIYDEHHESDSNPKLTTDEYKFFITQNTASNKDAYKYIITITGSKESTINVESNGVTVSQGDERTTSKDERLSQDVVGYLTQDGKLSWLN